MIAAFLLGLAPFASGIVLAYLIGRSDGRRAEQRRRLAAMNGLTRIRRTKSPVTRL